MDRAGSLCESPADLTTGVAHAFSSRSAMLFEAHRR
jgi:hypothetical protein